MNDLLMPTDNEAGSFPTPVMPTITTKKLTFHDKVTKCLSSLGSSTEEIDQTIGALMFGEETSRDCLLAFIRGQAELADEANDIEVGLYTFTSGAIAVEVSNKKEVSLIFNDALVAFIVTTDPKIAVA